MFEMLGRPQGRPWAAPSAAALVAHPSILAAPAHSRGEPVIIQMRENRSHLPEAGRQTVAVLGFALMVLMIVPALKGHWLVPLYAMLTMAALTFALDRHGKSVPRAERLEFSSGRVRHCAADGQSSEFATFGLRFAAEEVRPFDCRLFLRSRERSVEIGLCIADEERRALAPLIAATIQQSRGA